MCHPISRLPTAATLWIERGLLVTAGADQFPSPPAPGPQDGLDKALQVAQTRAVLDFVADRDLSPEDAGYYSLACVALAGHQVCNGDVEFLTPASGFIRIACPRSGTDAEVDGIGDPLAPPCAAPEVGPGWADLLATAAWVAAHGLPARTANRAVWWLVSAMVATTSTNAAPWARTLSRLAGYVRCLECGTVCLRREADPDTQRRLFTVDTSASPDAQAERGPGQRASIDQCRCHGQGDRLGRRRPNRPTDDVHFRGRWASLVHWRKARPPSMVLGP
jgi:hypothetical protein